MSENGEHSPDDTETEKNVLEEDLSKSETKLMMNQSNTALLEDEEMPTYISVSSLSRREHSDVNVKLQENVSMEEECSPCPSDDQAASSIYVLSSGDEDDEDEYADTDDMENPELDNDLDSEHQHNLKHMLDEDDDDDDEDEEDDEEGPRSMRTDDEDIMNYDDVNYRAEGLYRGSADFILNKPLENHHKKRSCSLQDLNIYEKDQRRHFRSDLGQTCLNIPQNMMYSIPRRKQSIPSKYHHVQSKVKTYIKDIKEQNKRSVEKHVTDQEDYDIIPDKSNINNDNNTEEMNLVTNNKIKNYAEKTIKELEIAEAYDRNKIAYNAPQIVLNGNKNSLEAIGEQSLQNKIQINTVFSIAQNEKDIIKCNEKIQKQNGAGEVSFSEKEDRNFGNAMQPSILQNGHPEVFFNLRNITYDNYMRYSSISNQKTELNKNPNIIEWRQMQSETCNNAEVMDISDVDNNDAACQLKNENIKSIRSITDESKNNNEQITLENANEGFNKIVTDSVEVIALKEQLNQKTVQYNNLRDAYHIQLAENLKIKQELEELKKSLSKCETNSKPLEQKVASVQTDCILNPVQSQDNNETEARHVKQSDNKILGNSITSTLSSIDQWTDSACNLSISMKPPQMAKYSDDSIVLADATPRKTTRTLSRAFITSSRILQTLSNITQGKVKSESPLVRNSKKRLNENVTLEQQDDDASYQNQSSKSKKRKIADILEPSSFLQSFKSSPSVSESQSKANEIPDTESQLNYPSELVNKKLETQENSSNINTSQLANATSTESKVERANDPDDNVKCFVFHENENSKDRSFLILAEEPAKDKVINEKGRIRECGPYLLGNVEVRMSEINGTINIWGKEVNEESMLDHTNEINTSNKVKDNKKCYCWQKTPYKRFNNSNIACSTNKKSKEPASSNFSCQHSPSFNIKPSCSTDKTYADDSYNQSISPYEEACQPMKLRKEWSKYKRMHPQEKLRSYCNHNINTLEPKYNCSLHKEKQKYEDNHNCNKDKLNSKEHNFSKTSLESTKQSYEDIANSSVENNELICGYNTMQHQFMHDSEENCQERPKCCNINRNTFTYESLDTNPESNKWCNHNSSSINEEDPLITLKHSSEFSETSRRRLRGKRVRGILMDLLRGCGDICNSNSPNNKNCSYKKKIPHSPNCSSQIKISSCTSPEPHCSNSVQSGGRCCHAYARIESQLEEFRIQIEKVQSRSDVILDMLYRLHSEDMN